MKIYFSNTGCGTEYVNFNRLLKATNSTRALHFADADVVIAHFCGMSSDSFKDIMPSMAILEGMKANSKIVGDVKVYVGGCAAEVVNFKKMFPFIDGTFRRGHLIDDLSKYFGYNPDDFRDIPSSYGNIITISRGCNRHCGFCKKAYMNMSVSSRPIQLVLQDVNEVITNGHRSIMLIAENSTEYGIDLPEQPKLLDLLKKIEEVEEIHQITLTGLCIDELVLNSELIEYIKNSSKITQVQVEIQSLDPLVRHQMRLTSTTEQVLWVMKEFSRKSIISNIMIGYPGETTEGFNKQLEVIKENNLYFVQVNKYDDTPRMYANSLAQIPENLVSIRLMELMLAVQKLRKQQFIMMKNHTYKAIMRENGKFHLINFYAVVECSNSKGISIDEIIDVEITEIQNTDLMDPLQSFLLKGRVKR